MEKTKKIPICIDCNKEVVYPLLLTACWVCEQDICRLCSGMGNSVACRGCNYWGGRGIDPTSSSGVLTITFDYSPTQGEILNSCWGKRFIGELNFSCTMFKDEIRNARYVFLKSDAHKQYISELRHRNMGFKIDVDFYINGDEQDPDKHISILRCCNFDPDFAKVE